MSDMKNTAAKPLLQVKHLRKQYKQKENIVQAVDDVDICLQAGEILGVVGESGCGKSTLARCIIRLIGADEGEILW
ncbi:MAG: ATP-binding cassette domain-containing protein [Firmicutes bacterium]|nr:ATP-binding cassette domain-containing protein [Bacillota bacterium]